MGGIYVVKLSTIMQAWNSTQILPWSNSHTALFILVINSLLCLVTQLESHCHSDGLVSTSAFYYIYIPQWAWSYTENGEIAFMETMPHALPKHFLDAKLGSKSHVYCVSTQ